MARGDIRFKLTDVLFLSEIFLLLYGAAAAAMSSLQFSVPGERPFLTLKTGFFVFGIWGFILAAQAVQAAWVLGAAHMYPGGMAGCAVKIILMAAPMAWFLSRLIGQGAPMNPFQSYLLAGLAAAGLAAMGMQFVCGLDQPAHGFVWHFLPIFAIVMGAKLIFNIGQK